MNLTLQFILSASSYEAEVLIQTVLQWSICALVQITEWRNGQSYWFGRFSLPEIPTGESSFLTITPFYKIQKTVLVKLYRTLGLCYCMAMS